MIKGETIIELGGEGGRIVLKGFYINNEWYFSLERNELALKDFVDEDDDISLYLSKSGLVRGFEQGLRLLDQYPWTKLSPRNVHPYFAEKLLNELKQRTSAEEEYKLRIWERAMSRKK